MVLQVCQIFLLVSYKPPVYNEYSYPAFAEGIGWFIAFLPLLPLFLIGGYELYKSKSSSGSITEVRVSMSLDINSYFLPLE